jgi:hypothetical protein
MLVEVKRRLFAIAAALSLLTFLATATLWVRSQFIADGLGKMTSEGRDDGFRRRFIESVHGRLLYNEDWTYFSMGAQIQPNEAIDAGWRRHTSHISMGSSFAANDIDWLLAEQRVTPDGRVIRFGFRLSPIIIASAVLPAIWLIVLLRRRRLAKLGHCPACGYDLRESKERCPECGKVVAGT